MDQQRQTRPLVIVGFVSLVLSFLFKWEFIYSEPAIDRLLGSIGLTAWSNDNSGFHYTGIMSIILLIMGLFFLAKQYSGKMIFVFFLVIILIPTNLFANVYQSSFANGIYALEFQQDGSNCQYDTNDSGIVEGNCKISIVNHSSDVVTFRVSIDSKYDHNRFNVTDLINLKDHQLKLDANEHRTFNINFRHLLQSSKYQSVGGELDIFNLIIDDDDNTRRL
ncbi:hypothetical protein GCM10007063_17580 [Lentibacillus kapialis]|uniref:Uncharacterized protein n=1 Tax=Lentibacillus kapialis TaxID=340214 RepID=A0A917PX52_9BACI|nr:hypothetical protein [Lentibacillus kapialis]GGJ95590.1 hypothetical protein GCM10007063_17580 [Lentibacillus kapialis]